MATSRSAVTVTTTFVVEEVDGLCELFLDHQNILQKLDTEYNGEISNELMQNRIETSKTSRLSARTKKEDGK